MPTEVWVVIGGVVLAGAAGSFWWARQYDRRVATYHKQVDAANES
jgi:positive regulator of sigma E activity